MKIWQSISWAEAEQLTEIAKFAEDVGYYGVINAEHLFRIPTTVSNYPYSKSYDTSINYDLDKAYPDVWSSFAAMAAVTSRLYFSTSVYLLPLRNPFEVAKQAATCARISNDRVTLGFGVGWQKEEFDAVGVDFHTRGKRTDEMIDVIRKLWQGQPVTHHGAFFHCEGVEIRPAPSKPLPLYCGGTSPAALRRAAQQCDGFIGPGSKIEDVPTLIRELGRLRKEAGRDHLPFETIVPIVPLDASRGPDDFRRLEDMGVTATFLPPFHVCGIDPGPTTGPTSIEYKKRAMEHYANNILRKMG